MAGAVVKPAGENFETSDQMMCEVLLMAGHKACSVQPGQDGNLVYTFPIEAVWPTVESILTGNASNMTFTYSDWWTARVTWQMNLRHLSQNRRKNI